MEKMSFEEAITELEKVVGELENQKLPLEESVKRFEKGMELSRYCNDLLEQAEKSIHILIEQADGSMKEEEFNITKEE